MDTTEKSKNGKALKKFNLLNKLLKADKPQENDYGLYFTTLCPIHEDEQNSLSISTNYKKISYKCFAGCDHTEIRAHYQNLLDKNTKKPTKQKKNVKASTVYTYHDEDGLPLYEIKRLEYTDGSKAFPSTHIVDNQRKKGLGPRGPVLYRLPNVLKRQTGKGTVFLVEGEKDADNLIYNFKLCATTAPNGAQNWNKTFTDSLRGCNVVVLVDNDEPGINRGEQVSLRLLPHAKSVRLLPPFEILAEDDTPIKGSDVSDWIEAGGTREELLQILKNTKLFKESDADIDNFQTVEKERLKEEQEEKTAQEFQESLLSTVSLCDEEDLYKPATDYTWVLRLQRSYGHLLKYIPDRKEWLFYHEGVWDYCKRVYAFKCVLEMSARASIPIKQQIEDSVDDDEKETLYKILRDINNLQNKGPSTAVVTLAEDTGLFNATEDDFDTLHPDKINCLNGVVDLRTGDLLPHSHTYMFTKRAPVNYEKYTESKELEKFICSLFTYNDHDIDQMDADVSRSGWVELEDGTYLDTELVGYVKRWLGYCITGELKEQKLTTFYGRGSNGKSALLKILRGVLGHGTQGFSEKIGVELLVKQRRDSKLDAGQLSELVNLRGVRFLYTSEFPKHGRLNSDMVKNLTDDEGLKAKGMRENLREIKVCGKWTIQTNHPAGMSATEDSIWRRFVHVTFRKKFEGDENTPEVHNLVLKGKDGVFSEIVKESIAYYKEMDNKSSTTESRLSIPDKLIAELEDIKQDENWLEDFLSTFCIKRRHMPDVCCKVHELYNLYSDWAKANGFRNPLTNVFFGREMGNYGYKSKVKKLSGEPTRVYQGIKLKKNYAEILQEIVSPSTADLVKGMLNSDDDEEEELIDAEE